MKDDKKILKQSDDELSKQSDVTPKPKELFIKTPVFKIVAGITVLFIICSYLSPRAESQNKEDKPFMSQFTNTSLNQNLAKLSAMKEAEKAQKEQQKIRDFLKTQRPSNSSEDTGHHQIIVKSDVGSIPSSHSKVSRKLKARMKAESTFVNVTYEGINSFGELNSSEIHVPTKAKGNDTITQANATRISHPDFTLSAGELIEATIETAINSELPGMVRAITTRDIYSLDSIRLLIPKGSKLVGQYASTGISQTQTRILVSWSRIQLPNGIIATLNSPATGTLGRAGIQVDSVDSHFIKKFGGSLLFSVLGAYTANAGVNDLDRYNTASQYRTSLVQSFQQTASNTLSKNVNIPPTLKIKQGSKVNVFVARDISFYDVLSSGGSA